MSISVALAVINSWFLIKMNTLKMNINICDLSWKNEISYYKKLNIEMVKPAILPGGNLSVMDA